MTRNIYHIKPGVAHPLGAMSDEYGVNFSLFSEHATFVELLLFAQHDDPEPFQVILLDPLQHRTFHFWHVYVCGLRPDMHYAYRLGGPQVGVHQTGDRFHRNKVVLDPYAREAVAQGHIYRFALSLGYERTWERKGDSQWRLSCEGTQCCGPHLVVTIAMSDHARLWKECI